MKFLQDSVGFDDDTMLVNSVEYFFLPTFRVKGALFLSQPQNYDFIFVFFPHYFSLGFFSNDKKL